MLRQFSRWLYRGHRSNTLARWINRGTAVVFAPGIALNYFVILEVVVRLEHLTDLHFALLERRALETSSGSIRWPR